MLYGSFRDGQMAAYNEYPVGFAGRILQAQKVGNKYFTKKVSDERRTQWTKPAAVISFR